MLTKRIGTRGKDCPLTKGVCSDQCAWAVIVEDEPYCAVKIIGDDFFIKATKGEYW